MTSVSEATIKAFNKAKIGMMVHKNSVFITTVLFSLKHVWTDKIPTAGTDGLNLLLNEQFFMALSPDERIFLLAHESWHVAFSHMTRKGDRDHSVYNQAGDHVINLMLKEAGFKMPEGGLADENYKGWTTTKVYDDLMVHCQKQDPDFQPDIIEGGDPGDGDGAEGNGGSTPSQQEALEQAITDILVKASTQSRMQGDAAGTVPGEIEVALEKLLNPKLPWSTLLQNYMTSLSKEDYSFRRPNRRFMPDFILPSLYSDATGEIAVAVDTSGSVSDVEFAAFLSEIHHIKNRLNPSKIIILDFDTTVKAVHEITKDESLASVKFHGRGGTNLSPVFRHFEKKKPHVLIVFSDLHCSPIETDPGYPVIWICVNNSRGAVNFGKLIHMEIDNGY